MALASGLASQIGFKVESSYGTYVAVDRFFPLVSEKIEQHIDRLESKAIIANARVERSQQWVAGNITVAGSIQMELYNLSVGRLLGFCFGATATTGSAGAYTHTFTPGDLSDDSFTCQVGRPDITGTVQPFSYTGCQVDTWDLSAEQGQICQLALQVVGQRETTTQSLAGVSYAAGIAPMVFTGATVTVGGSSANIKKIALKGDNGLNKDRRFIGSAVVKQPLEAALRQYTGTLDMEFESLTAYNRFVNGTEAALVATFASGTQSLAVTTNVRFDGTTPGVAGPDLLMLSQPVKCVGASTDAGAITAVFSTTESTP